MDLVEISPVLSNRTYFWRYRPDLFAFFFSMRRKIIVRLRRAVGGNCPPDSCILTFKSGLTISPKQKGHPTDVLFVLARVDKKDALFNNNKITCFGVFDILIFLAFCYLQQASSESICYIFLCKTRDLYIQSLQLDCVQLSLYNR